MKLIRQLVLAGILWVVGGLGATGAMPRIETVGGKLGYPPAELLVEDNTVQERIVISSPSFRERGSKTILPDSGALLKAYIIQSKREGTFYPLQVYIGTKGAFLSSEALEKMAEWDAAPTAPKLGKSEAFPTVGKGGFYFEEHFKVKRGKSPLKSPGRAVALVAVVQPYGQDFDVLIAFRLDMDLQPIAGGEEYFNNFGPYDNKNGNQRLGYAQIFLELNKIVIAEWLAEEGAGSGSAPSQPVPAEQSVPSGKPILSPRHDPPATPASDAWVWWSGGLLLSLLAFVIHALRKRRS